MSIRPDVWIKKMAVEQRMIEPFVERQVRQRDGRSVVSYGLSSFLRHSRIEHFRIFTTSMDRLVRRSTPGDWSRSKAMSV